MLLSLNQKKLILTLLKKENKKLFSKYKGDLLKKTIEDMQQQVNNQVVNRNHL